MGSNPTLSASKIKAFEHFAWEPFFVLFLFLTSFLTSWHLSTVFLFTLDRLNGKMYNKRKSYYHISNRLKWCMREPDNLSDGSSCFIRVRFFRGVTVAAVIRRLSRMVVHGVGSIALTQKRNYMQHISTPAKMTQKSWRRTGDMLRTSMEYVGDYAEAKQAKEG